MKRSIALIVVILLLLCLHGASSNPNQRSVKNYTAQESSFFDSLNVHFVGNWPYGQADEIAYDSARNLVFLSSGQGVYILDVDNPADPIKVSESLHSRDFIHQNLFYDLSNQRLYIAVSRWFEIWDISNPYSPALIGKFSTSGPSYGSGDIFISDSYAYCVDDANLCVVDVSSPSNPVIVGRLAIPGASIAVKDSFAFIVSYAANGFHVIDVSDPQNPIDVASLWQKGTDIFQSDSFVYISSTLEGLKFRIIDISDPYNPQFCGYFDSPDEVHHTHVIDTIAYMATRLGFRVVNISDPMNPQELSYTFCRGRDIFVEDSLSYVVDRDAGLRVFDISSPTFPLEIAQFITPGRSFESQVSGAFAYIANEKGLWIIDVSDPNNAIERGRCYTPYEIFDVRISGSYAFAVDRDSGFTVFDISNPSNPYIVSILNLPGWHYGHHKSLDVSGHHAYIADGYNGLRIVDISNPSFPYEVAQCSIAPPLPSIDVAISGLYAYVVSIQWFSVVDISDPSNPEIVAATSDLYRPSDICISGTYAFVTDSFGLEGNYVFDISNIPPQKIEYIPQIHNTGIHASGLYAYVSNILASLRVWDISQPSNLFLVGYYNSAIYNFDFHGIYSSGANAYISTDCGLQIYQFYGAGVEEELEEPPSVHASLKLLQNPTKGNSIKLMLTTNNPDNCTMYLYNVLGQQVKSFNLKNLAIGSNHIDLPVDNIPNGIYFLRLKDGHNIQSEKVVILK